VFRSFKRAESLSQASGDADDTLISVNQSLQLMAEGMSMLVVVCVLTDTGNIHEALARLAQIKAEKTVVGNNIAVIQLFDGHLADVCVHFFLFRCPI
jgi:hypothetical protein